jgi:hypothetical protein
VAVTGGFLIVLYDATTGKKIRSFGGHESRVRALTFSPDGRLLASCSGDSIQRGFIVPEHSVRLWDVETGRQLLRIDGEALRICSVAYSPDGQLLASADRDVRVWEVCSGREVLRFQAEGGAVYSVAFSPDGANLASALGNGTALVWRVKPPDWRVPAAEPSSKELDRLWADLGDGDARKAFRASCTLAATPRSCIAFLEDRLRPVPAVLPSRIRRLVKDLDADRYVQREAASRELARWGRLAEPVLRQALAETKSPEARRRLKVLVRELPDWVIKDPETLRTLRAIGVLGRIGSPEARALLQKLAQGAPEARQTQAARMALLLPNKTRRR